MSNSNDDPEEMTALFGPLAKYSDHKIGEHIQFKLNGTPVTGEITWITEAGPTATGKHHAPVTYICHVEGHDWPVLVYQTEVLYDR